MKIYYQILLLMTIVIVSISIGMISYFEIIYGQQQEVKEERTFTLKNLMMDEQIAETELTKNQTTMDIDNLWEITKMDNCCNLLPDNQQLKILRLDREYPGLLDDIKDASETCDALKYYGDLDKNTDCKTWYQTEWKFWKKLNK
jgi:hypothetical protein